ncbi:protein furry isoform X2 [Harmonia axyridis]|uniref:protein furry isoform X2 n=1 Tax=Harmonia axyridis TaxID=115357 RepID=UPI001E2791AD|nr:protein furry isoform X2 [Harmonia axyridis]
MSDSLTEHDHDLVSNDSDAEGSHSVCSDTHSDTASGITEKSTLSGSTIQASLGNDDNSTNPSSIADSDNKTANRNIYHRDILLPWGAQKERTSSQVPGMAVDMDIRPGEYVMRSLFAVFTVLAEKKIDSVLNDSQVKEKTLSKALQRGEDAQFDQLLSAFGSVAEHCLPSLLKALFSWYERQMSEVTIPELKKTDPKQQKSIISIVSGGTTETGERSEAEIQKEKRDLAVEFIFCLVLIEVLKQLSFHPGHEDLVQYIENLAFKHFKYKEGIQNNPNAANIHIIADLYAEVVGVLAQSRFMSVRTRFMNELKELRSREPSPNTTQSIISLLMGMKFFRVKMVPIEEFEASFQFMQECAQYFLEVKDKDIKHALAGLFVEILVPVAAAVKNEVNVPCLKHFVETLFFQGLDSITKSKHRLALFPLLTCLLCVSQKQFFLQNWPSFLIVCLQHLKNRDLKMCRVALESMYRLLWVYVIRLKCESNSVTQSRILSIVNSLFPKGSKVVVPRDTPLNIFVKIIHFIAQERLDFSMKEIIYDLLSVGKPIKIILTPERMSIGLRAFLVIADSLQEKEGEPPMPRSVGIMPSGNTLRVKKTFKNKVLTEDTIGSIGMSSYFPSVRTAFAEILVTLDSSLGKPFLMTNTQNLLKPEELMLGERKPKMDLFRTCVAAVPRLIPDDMTSAELVDLLSRLTVHMDEEVRALAYQSLQTLVFDLPDWRHDVIWGLTQFLMKDILDTSPQLMDNGLKMVLNLLITWKNAISGSSMVPRMSRDYNEFKSSVVDSTLAKKTDTVKIESLNFALNMVEALAMVMLCNNRLTTRRVSVLILKEVKTLFKLLNISNIAAIEVMDKCCPKIIEKYLYLLPPAEKSAVQSNSSIDLQWLSERNSNVWTAGLCEDGTIKSGNSYSFTVVDPWCSVLFDFFDTGRLIDQCPTLISNIWPIVFSRLNTLYSVVDVTPLNDNRASLLRSSTAVKKTPSEKDAYLHLYKNYITLACRVLPRITPPVIPIPQPPPIRCVSPDSSSSSNTDSSLSSNEKIENKLASVSPTNLYKLVVPFLRCEVPDVRDTTIYALGHIHHDALGDLLEELVPFIKDIFEKKQENVRRRRRKNPLRLTLIKLFEQLADKGTLGASSWTIDKHRLTLIPQIIEFIEAVRYHLELETDKNSPGAVELILHFCNFIKKMFENFDLEKRANLLKRELRRKIFLLFSQSAGKYALKPSTTNEGDQEKISDFQYAVLQSMSAVLCSGRCFSPNDWVEESPYYPWLDRMLNSNEEKVFKLAQETIILLLEANPDIGLLVDWLIEKCFTYNYPVADECFLALSYMFSTREYPCDHYYAVINVTLMNTGCPRTHIRDTALQLLQILDKRFFGSVSPHFERDTGDGTKRKGTLDSLLATTFCRSQVYLSSQLAHLHPELTMPMFSEITYRFNTARSDIRPMLLEYILPWLHNMELVDPNVPPQYYQYYSSENVRTKREGWGSSEATEMVLNNMFYITAKFGDYHPKEIELVWKTLCSSWPNNMRVIIRYLIIISGMAPTELLPYAKRVVLYMARVQPSKLFDEMMTELQTVETLNFNIERTETPPFYRLTMMRKTSSHSDGNTGQVDSNSRYDLSVEKGTIHTKRHSGEDPSKVSHALGDFTMEKCKNPDDMYSDENPNQDKCDMPIPQPHPLPMPEYGGYFAPLSVYLPDSSQLISSFHRCNIGVMLLCDVVIDGLELDWTIHVPLMLHVAFLGLDHTRPLVHTHCKQLLLNLLIVIAQHNDYLTVAQILMTTKTEELELGLSIPSLPVISHNYTEPDPVFDAFLNSNKHQPEANASKVQSADPPSESEELTESEEETSEQKVKAPEVNLHASSSTTPKLEQTTPNIIKSLIAFLAKRNDDSPLWNYEDITAKVWSIKSAEQMETLLQHVVHVFRESLPLGHINERWAQTALQLGLSCSSRHYAGRSLQIFRALKVPITTRMLSDILSRLVETVAEQGEDMQGYVTELLLTLEAAVDSLESDFRPIDCMKEFFKSTPNLNNKETAPKKGVGEGQSNVIPQINYQLQTGHARSTSYSVSYGFKKSTSSPNDGKDRGRSSHEPDHKIPLNKFASNLARSRSAQSLKMLGDSATQDDKMTILAQLFWLAVSLLESDYEHEFLLAVRLLKRVLHRLPLDRPDARDKVEKLQQQLRWTSFPGVHALLLKGCTHPNTYEPVMELLSQLTLLLNLSVIDPSQNIAFPMNVIALLPYLLLNYEDANELCIRAAENIAQVSIEKSKKLENLGTVMNLYSRRTFSKESFQWTKCVIKYLYDTYSYLSLNMLSLLVEILEKGPSTLQLAVLNIIHCMLHYVDLVSAAGHPINSDLLRVIVKYIDGVHWKEALKILKLVVSRSSSLVTPPSSTYSQWESSLSSTSHANFGEDTSFSKKELPGRTMDFTFDLSQTPVIGRKYLNTKEETANSPKVVATPRRSCSLSPADAVPSSGWKRPWMCQGRVRECLVNLLTTCGQRVGLPKSPSVIFSQTSDLIERQSSMASSTEEVSLGNNDASGGSRRDETATDFGVFKDFDFLEYESESIEGESTDNFNWGVRRRPLSQGDHLRHGEDSVSELTPVLTSRKKMVDGESSDEEIESESPLDEIVAGPEFENNAAEGACAVFPPSSLNLRDPASQIISSGRSDTRSSAGDLGEVTPCNTSPSLGIQRPQMRIDALENYQSFVEILQSPPTNPQFFQQLQKMVKTVCQASFESSKEACSYLSLSSIAGQPIVKLINSRLNSVIDSITFRIMVPNLVWFNENAVSNLNLGETLKCAILQVQEHLELFCDKKQQLTMYCDAVKTTLKLEMLSGQPSEYRHDQYFMELGKSIFKLYFQLLLLVEAVNKLVCLLHTTLLAADFKDMTPEVLTIRNALARTFEDTEADGGVASLSTLEENNESYDSTITRLLDRQEWTQCVLYFKQHRSAIITEYEDICDRDDDIHTILNIYCKRKMMERPDQSTNTNQQPDASDVFGRLFQFSSATSELETLFKDPPPS